MLFVRSWLFFFFFFQAEDGIRDSSVTGVQTCALPICWYIKRQAARLGLTMKMERRPWTQAELDRLENLVGRVSSATIAKRMRRPESYVVNKLKRLVTSRRVRD